MTSSWSPRDSGKAGISSILSAPTGFHDEGTEGTCVVSGELGEAELEGPEGIMRALAGKEGGLVYLLNMNLQNLLGFGLTRSHRGIG